MTATPSRLPRTANNGTEVCDRNGNIWKYNAVTNSWAYRGQIAVPDIATKQSDGLVTPDTLRRLQDLQAFYDAGFNFDVLKIYPALDAYWYYLTSHNHTIRFYPETSSRLRIEVNRPRLLALLSKVACPGLRGDKGPKGPSGRDGDPGTPEPTYTAAVVGNTIAIDATAPSTIATPILLRLCKNGAVVLQIKVQTDNSGFSIEYLTSEVVLINTTSLSYDSATGHLSGELIANESFDSEAVWTYKAWQMGRRGPRGVDGRGFLDVVEAEFFDDLLRSRQAIVSLRHGSNGTDLYYFASELFTKNCVNKLNFGAPRADDAVVFDYCLVAVKMTTESCKDIAKYQFIPARSAYGLFSGGGKDPDGNVIPISPPPLVLPEWTPVEACWSQRNWSISQYNWKELVDLSKDNLGWQTANERDSRSPAYPWIISEPRQPGVRCCSDDLWYCPNINDQPCGVVGPDGNAPIILPPQTPQLCCECDCPIALDLQDGYDFDEVGITSDRKVYVGVGDVYESDRPCQSVTCTLDGTTHEYRMRVIIQEQRYPIRVKLYFRVGYSDLCDEAREAYQNDAGSNPNILPSFGLDCGKPVPVEQCPFQWSVSDVSREFNSGPLELMFREGPESEVAINGETVTMSWLGRVGIIDINVLVNLNRASCCLGYGLDICVNHQPEEPPVTTTTTTTTTETTTTTLGPESCYEIEFIRCDDLHDVKHRCASSVTVVPGGCGYQVVVDGVLMDSYAYRSVEITNLGSCLAFPAIHDCIPTTTTETTTTTSEPPTTTSEPPTTTTETTTTSEPTTTTTGDCRSGECLWQIVDGNPVYVPQTHDCVSAGCNCCPVPDAYAPGAEFVSTKCYRNTPAECDTTTTTTTSEPTTTTTYEPPTSTEPPTTTTIYEPPTTSAPTTTTTIYEPPTTESPTTTTTIYEPPTTTTEPPTTTTYIPPDPTTTTTTTTTTTAGPTTTTTAGCAQGSCLWEWDGGTWNLVSGGGCSIGWYCDSTPLSPGSTIGEQLTNCCLPYSCGGACNWYCMSTNTWVLVSDDCSDVWCDCADPTALCTEGQETQTNCDINTGTTTTTGEPTTTTPEPDTTTTGS